MIESKNLNKQSSELNKMEEADIELDGEETKEVMIQFSLPIKEYAQLIYQKKLRGYKSWKAFMIGEILE